MCQAPKEEHSPSTGGSPDKRAARQRQHDVSHRDAEPAALAVTTHAGTFIINIRVRPKKQLNTCVAPTPLVQRAKTFLRVKTEPQAQNFKPLKPASLKKQPTNKKPTGAFRTTVSCRSAVRKAGFSPSAARKGSDRRMPGACIQAPALSTGAQRSAAAADSTQKMSRADSSGRIPAHTNLEDVAAKERLQLRQLKARSSLLGDESGPAALFSAYLSQRNPFKMLRNPNSLTVSDPTKRP